MKKFIIRFLLICSPFVVLYAYPMLRYAHGESFGDLSQLGSYFFHKDYISMMAYDPGFKRHVVLAEDITKEVNDSDVVVIGDSFTQLGYNNFMEYLQDGCPNRTIYGVHTYRYGMEWHYAHQSLEGSDKVLDFPGKADVVLYLLHHAKRLPSTIVIESSEMWLMESIIKANFDVCEDSLKEYEGAPLLPSAEKYEIYTQKLVQLDALECLLDGRAFRFAQDWVKHKSGVSECLVKTSALSQPMFNCKGNESTLYYLPYMLNWSETDIETMRSRMAQIVEEGDKRGVNIVYMILPLKEHLYKEYMLTAGPQATYLSDHLTDLADNPHYLLCYPILKDMLERGEQDVFLCSDTHWSYKGAQACAEALQSKIKSAEQ